MTTTNDPAMALVMEIHRAATDMVMEQVTPLDAREALWGHGDTDLGVKPRPVAQAVQDLLVATKRETDARGPRYDTRLVNSLVLGGVPEVRAATVAYLVGQGAYMHGEPTDLDRLRVKSMEGL